MSGARAAGSLRDPATCAVALLGLLLWSAPAGAMGIERLETSYADGSYGVRLEATLDAPPAQVLAVLKDYAAYPALDERVVESRVIGEEAGQPLLYTRLRGCVGSVFCRDMVRVERITELDDGLIADVIPSRSDMQEGRSETRLSAAGNATRITYELRFRMSLWVPQWLVRRAMLHTLEDGTRSMFVHIEERARETAPR